MSKIKEKTYMEITRNLSKEEKEDLIDKISWLFFTLENTKMTADEKKAYLLLDSITTDDICTNTLCFASYEGSNWILRQLYPNLEHLLLAEMDLYLALVEKATGFDLADIANEKTS